MVQTTVVGYQVVIVTFQRIVGYLWSHAAMNGTVIMIFQAMAGK